MLGLIARFRIWKSGVVMGPKKHLKTKEDKQRWSRAINYAIGCGFVGERVGDVYEEMKKKDGWKIIKRS